MREWIACLFLPLFFAGIWTITILIVYLVTHIRPTFAGGWYLLGRSYLSGKVYNRAIEAFQKALELKKQDSTYWYYLGVAYSDSSKPRKAIAAYKNAVSIDPHKSY